VLRSTQLVDGHVADGEPLDPVADLLDDARDLCASRL